MKKIEIHNDYKLRILELFGGVGASRVALDNLFADCQVQTVSYVDILNWANFAYNQIAKTCYIPQSVEFWTLGVDMVIHGSPCQDFSTAGKGKGGEKGTNTRSSLLWETIDIIQNRLPFLPEIVLWENVTGVLNQTHKPTFDKYLETMQNLGYENRYDILNGVDFGTPQRRKRVFVYSVLKNSERFYHFNFNNLQKTPTLPLKNFLEDKVDLKYFIKQKSMIKAIETGKIKIVENEVFTVTTKQMRWNNAGVIKIPFSTFNQENYVFNPENSTLPTLTASGANSRLKIAIPKFSDDLPVFIIDDLPYHLRVITEREAWRLMGFRDEHFDKLALLPSTAKYYLAGNSMIVQVMEAIFKEIFRKEGLNG